MGGIAPVSKEDLADAAIVEKYYVPYAKKGIEYYNDLQKDEKLELVSILNATVQIVCGTLYYLTISAKNENGVIRVYQTRVGAYFASNSNERVKIVVELFRVKPSSVAGDQGNLSISLPKHSI